MKPLTANTLTRSDDATPPAARIEQMAWLAGGWEGGGLEGWAEEIWSRPLAGAMMGMFRLTKEDRPQFFELLCIAEESGSLLLRIKHFHADLKGWEDRDQAMEFPLLALRQQEACFDGLTLRRRGDVLEAFVAAKSMDGGLKELAFRYRRQTAASES